MVHTDAIPCPEPRQESKGASITASATLCPSLNVSLFVGASQPDNQEHLPRHVKAIAPQQEVRIDADALIPPPTLPRRSRPRLSPDAPRARSPGAMASRPQPRQRSVGPCPRPTRGHTLWVPRRPAHRQRSPAHPAAPEEAVGSPWDSGAVSVVSGGRGSPQRPRGGAPSPPQLSVGRVAAPCRAVVGEAAAVGGPRCSGCALSQRCAAGTRATGWAAGVGTPAAWSRQEARAWPAR